MILECTYDIEAVGNPFFKKIYDKVFNELNSKFKEYQFIHKQPTPKNISRMSSPGGGSNFQITNPTNKKTILLSFWDRGMNLFEKDLGWEDYDLIDYYGGIGMFETSEKIKEKYGVNHYPLQYPLGVKNSDIFIEKHRIKYNFENRIPKAIFIGRMHGSRKKICEILKKHPNIEIFDENDTYYNERYFEKIKDYRMGISLNGNGEFCLRDVEYMGMEIPIIRPKLKTKFYNPLNENEHFIPVDIESENAHSDFFGKTEYEVAQKIIEVVESNINNKDVLTEMAKNGRDYFVNFTSTDYISELFIKLINIKNIT